MPFDVRLDISIVSILMYDVRFGAVPIIDLRFEIGKLVGVKTAVFF